MIPTNEAAGDLGKASTSMNRVAENSSLVSVVMAVYNAGQYLEKSIGSILNQTFGEFEFIIINDGSTDETATILNSFGDADNRIKVFHHENRGFHPALNVGCKLATGKYIARMDADDISLPERFARQLSFLETYPEIAVCGSWVKKIGKSRGNVWRLPTNPDEIRCTLLFNNPIAHPAAMIRRDALAEVGYYDETYLYTGDYACWTKIAEKRAIANIPEVLLHYRVHPAQMGTSYSDDLRASEHKRGQAYQLERMGLSPTREGIDIHNFLSVVKLPTTPVYPSFNSMQKANEWLLKLKTANDRSQVYSEPMFSQILSTHWYFLCRANTKIGLGAWRTYSSSPLVENKRIAAREKAAFVLKSVLRYDVNNRLYLFKIARKFFALQEKLGIG